MTPVRAKESAFSGGAHGILAQLTEALLTTAMREMAKWVEANIRLAEVRWRSLRTQKRMFERPLRCLP